MHCMLEKVNRSIWRYVLQVWHAEDPEEEVLAMVVRTGLYTSTGSMIRQILSPSFSSAEKYPLLQVRHMLQTLQSRLPQDVDEVSSQAGFQPELLSPCVCMKVAYCKSVSLAGNLGGTDQCLLCSAGSAQAVRLCPDASSFHSNPLHCQSSRLSPVRQGCSEPASAMYPPCSTPRTPNYVAYYIICEHDQTWQERHQTEFSTGSEAGRCCHGGLL